eukprot:630430-Rhodomonas_salina.2
MEEGPEPFELPPDVAEEDFALFDRVRYFLALEPRPYTLDFGSYTSDPSIRGPRSSILDIRP